MKKLTQWERGWLSGIIDSDGSVGFNRASRPKRTNETTGKIGQSITCRIQVDGISKEFIEAIHKTVGEGWFITDDRKKAKGLMGITYKTMYRWSAGSNTMRWLLPQLKLICKREKQQILIGALPILAKGRWKTEKEKLRLAKLIAQMKITPAKRNNKTKIYDI
jgi:hypothetical protein